MSVLRQSPPTSPLAGRHVLLGVTGGIAAYKACALVRLLVERDASVQVVMTEAATRFVGSDTFAALSSRPVHTDLFGQPERVLHVALAHEADVAAIVPATANTLAKVALGFADDLLTSTFLEVTAPLIVAPAMHTGMYENATTQENLRLLAERGVRIVGPVTGKLAAGDEGIGRMVEPERILEEMEAVIGRGRDLDGRRILVTAGPTWEPLDAVRFVGNRSSGKMGFAVAAEAAMRGADVTLVLGPGTERPPGGVAVVPVSTAEQMREAVLDVAERADAIVMAAAVADFRPEQPSSGKLKKEAGPPEIRLVANPDILMELGARKPDGQVLVGFAAETEQLEASGRAKLERKGADLMVVNEVGRAGTGFGSEDNHAMIVSRSGEDTLLQTWSKRELARELCDRIAKSLAG
ncbi:MAG: bifunctional phosphopantothenoylcysteine decarboxylase/phosphopantothenate--cysteine ligase CoaBC [Actinomycetota bacterium]